jgi:single-strand DNA-binding protein
MAYLNRTEIIGHLGHSPKTLDNGTIKKATFSVAVSERYRDRNGETKETTNWFTCVFFGKMAEVIERLQMEKGTCVYIGGKMNFRTYEKDGKKSQIAELIGENLQILSARRSDGSIQPTANAPTEVAEADELPF